MACLPETGKMAAAINDLGDGLRHALQEQMKSERMKADLITNVPRSEDTAYFDYQLCRPSETGGSAQ